MVLALDNCQVVQGMTALRRHLFMFILIQQWQQQHNLHESPVCSVEVRYNYEYEDEC